MRTKQDYERALVAVTIKARNLSWTAWTSLAMVQTCLITAMYTVITTKGMELTSTLGILLVAIVLTGSNMITTLQEYRKLKRALTPHSNGP